MIYFRIPHLIFALLWIFFTQPMLAQTSQAKSAAISLENAFHQVYQKVSPSVVSIATQRTIAARGKRPASRDPFFEYFFYGKKYKQKRRQTGLGSGIILSKDGYILTNAHVVRRMTHFTVKLKDKTTYPAKLIGSDSVLDLALLKIKTKTKLTPVRIGDSSKVRVGNWAIAIGAPLGFEQSFTVGVISSISRSGIDYSGLRYIQTDASINKGNSGGPLLNIHGEVIGINRMIASQTGGSVGIGFTIPINNAIAAAKQLKKNGKIKRAWLGVGLDAIRPEEQKRKKLASRRGAIIRQVLSGTPAEKAGLQVGDIIVQVGSKKIRNPRDVIQRVRQSKVGKRLRLKIIRKRKSIQLYLVPEERP
ncbi:MAG: trypsin-like peptidase domain-containing protein [Spirochaetota bacterium]